MRYVYDVPRKPDCDKSLIHHRRIVRMHWIMLTQASTTRVGVSSLKLSGSLEKESVILVISLSTAINDAFDFDT